MLKYLYYIRYFFYIMWNWNGRLALFTMYHEIRGESKYKLNTSRLNSLTGLAVTGNNLQHAEIYQGASYFLLENLFGHLRTLHQGKSFVDMGCGKGRALTVAAHYGFVYITGVDFARDLCREAEYNCKKLQTDFPAVHCRIICADAAEYRFEKEMDTIYFFNPFDQIVMAQVLKNLQESFYHHPRTLFVVYLNPQHKALFLKAGFEEVYYIQKMEFVEASILKKPVGV
ncbi:MAG: class I SAM-dependent methyltransferase [Williamsia sp.]|nr:class I SAM-dependent methyltransferase [Williamsia sp.]